MDAQIAVLFEAERKRLGWMLTNKLGLDRYAEVDDILQDTFLKALTDWGSQGIPEKPAAWLYQVAKNASLNYIKASSRFSSFESGDEHQTTSPSTEEATGQNNLPDELRIAIACCHPEIPLESQIALALKTLFGFSVQEVAKALCSSYDAIEKRLSRSRNIIRSHGLNLEPPADLSSRVPALLNILYLIFSEGYYSHGDQQIRLNLCANALTLALELARIPAIVSNEVYALISQFCYFSARLPARLQEEGATLLPYEAQDPSKFNQELITLGRLYLNKASTGVDITHWHLQAAIVAAQTEAPNGVINWPLILDYYQQLKTIKPGSSEKLGYLVALWRASGPDAAMAEAQLYDQELGNNYHYQVLLTQLARDMAASSFELSKQKALSLARNEHEKAFVNALNASLQPS